LPRYWEFRELTGNEPRVLVQAVKRNIERFPEDFMFQLSPEEFANLKSQFGISSWGGVRTAPYAFTEQGVYMLSSMLRSTRAIQVNIEIMRAFVQLRQMLASNGHGKDAAPYNETAMPGHSRYTLPLLNPLLQAGEGANESLRKFYVDAELSRKLVALEKNTTSSSKPFSRSSTN
jgi:hypothetical protein